LPLSPDQTVHDLSVGERQRIEIVRCLLQNPRLLIMDEPTSVLTPQEVEKLFETLRRLASEGCSILYISHKLDEIRALCDAATIMRLGRVVAHCVPSEKSAKELAELMINAQLDPPSRRRRVRAEGVKPRLVVDNLSVKSPHPFGADLKGVGFAVSPGEILGVAGIAGNGQTELMDALTGEIPTDSPETIVLEGVAVGRSGPQRRRSLGACFVPEERNGHGAVETMTLSENAFLTARARRSLARFGFVNQARSVDFAREIIRRFDVRSTGPKAQARALSGGNLGRRRRRGGGDPSRARGSGGKRRGGGDHLSGSGRDLSGLRPRRGDRRRSIVAADPGRGGDDRADRPGHGRRGREGLGRRGRRAAGLSG
jgi:simple sugar transport system ATP-binding protein